MKPSDRIRQIYKDNRIANGKDFWNKSTWETETIKAIFTFLDEEWEKGKEERMIKSLGL